VAIAGGHLHGGHLAYIDSLVGLARPGPAGECLRPACIRLGAAHAWGGWRQDRVMLEK